MTDYFMAGKVDTDQQIKDAGFDDLLNLSTDVEINPFLSLKMNNITLGSPNIQSSQVIFSDYGSSVYLTPQTQGIHLPTSIYDYMEDNFFQWICYKVDNFNSTIQQYLDLSQTYLALDECYCKGRDYFGMPTIELLTNKETANRDNDSNLYYIFTAAQIELFPKVNKLLRTTFCNLALWNLEDQYPDIK